MNVEYGLVADPYGRRVMEDKDLGLKALYWLGGQTISNQGHPLLHLVKGEVGEGEGHAPPRLGLLDVESPLRVDTLHPREPEGSVTERPYPDVAVDRSATLQHQARHDHAHPGDVEFVVYV